MKKTSLLFLLFCLGIYSGLSIAATTCYKKTDKTQAYTNGLSDLPRGTSCYAEPLTYQMKFYELQLCTSEPTAPTTSSTVDTTNCSPFLVSSSGSDVLIEYGKKNPISGTITKPPNGTYTHFLVRVSNQLEFTASVDFGSTNNLATSSDRYCVSQTGSETTRSNINAVCSSSETSTPGTTSTEKMYFGTNDIDNVIRIHDDSLGRDYLLDSNQHLSSAATSAEADYVMRIRQFSSPKVITDKSTKFRLSTSSKKGMNVRLSRAGVAQMDIGPFSVLLDIEESSASLIE